MHDLTIAYPNGTTGAVEVTAAADAQQLELWKLVGGRGKRWIEPVLIGGWVVRILPSTRARALRQQLPSLLHNLERDHVGVVRGDKTSTDVLNALAGQLGIVEAKRGPTAHPGSIYVMPPERPLKQMGGFSPATGDPLAQWLGEWIPHPSRADNLQKLARSGAPERHLFLLVPGFTSAPFAVKDLLMMAHAPIPIIPPVLPPEITHVWTMSTWSSGDGFRWAPETGWSRFVKVKPH
jgi:hypothetical protein